MAKWQNRIIDFIGRNASGRGKHQLLLTFIGALFFCSVLAALAGLAFAADSLLNMPVWPPWPVNLILAVPLLLAGSWLWGWSVWTFGRSGGTPVPVSPPPVLIATGPYAYSRNPMLTGVFLLLAGGGFLSQSLALVAIFTPLFMAVVFGELKLIEEPELERRIGPAYAEYRKRVPMFLPYRRRRP